MGQMRRASSGGETPGRKMEELPEMPTKRICGTMEVHRRLLAESESYARNREQIENLALAYKRGLQAVSRTGTVHIPVVVHVVWNAEDQNISDAQIQSQIDVLNKYFRKLNPDISQVPDVWKDLTADMTDRVFPCNKRPGWKSYFRNNSHSDYKNLFWY